MALELFLDFTHWLLHAQHRVLNILLYFVAGGVRCSIFHQGKPVNRIADTSALPTSVHAYFFSGQAPIFNIDPLFYNVIATSFFSVWFYTFILYT